MSDRTPVLALGTRTPIGRLGGGLALCPAVDLGAAAVRAVLASSAGLAPEYVAMGNVVQAGNGQNPARIAAVRGGIDRRVPGITLNDVCLASMSAVGLVARMISVGEITTGLVGGFESMSRAPWAVHRHRGKGAPPHPESDSPVDLLMHDGLWCALDSIGMGPLSDRENARLGIGREEQDAYSVTSHRRAFDAQQAGRLSEEIGAEVACDAEGSHAEPRPSGSPYADEGVRPDTSMERLAQLPAAFAATGTLTAGNSAQMSDAAAAGLVTTHQEAVAAGMAPLVAIEGVATVAGRDSSLHVTPAQAGRALLDRHGVSMRTVGLWEINEAFAGVVIASTRELGIELDRVNVNGGAIALGHPLGATGFRLVLTLALEMRRRGVEFGVAALCGGGGQGQAILLHSV